MEVLDGRELITIKREILINVPYQPPFAATVMEVEGDIFWTNLPREEGQVLVLQENQPVLLGVSLFRGYYSADSKVVALGNRSRGFYAFEIPENFSLSQERQFIRAEYAARVEFECGTKKVQTSLVNFSAAGVMVYMVPQLEEIVTRDKWNALYVKIDFIPEKLAVKLAWQRTRNNIRFAGFEFINLPLEIRETLNAKALEYSEDAFKVSKLSEAPARIVAKKPSTARENHYPTLPSKWQK